MAGDRPGTPDEVGSNEATRAVRRPAGGGAQDPWAAPPGGGHTPGGGRGDAYSAGQPAYRAPAGSGRGGADIANEPTMRGVLPGEAPQVAESPSGDDRARGRSKVYGKPRAGQAPVRPLPGAASPLPPDDPGRGARGPRPPRRTGRIILRVVAVLVVLLVVLAVGGFFWINSRLQPIDALTDYDGRPAATPGEDWLLVGSDSRAGLTAAQRRKLATGRAGGKRTDTMMLLHVPSGDGKPTLVSLPRDSYVPIDGHGSDKLNAAYSFGGPKLLAKTVEKVTGIRLDHYMEIGFGGFVGIVDAIGGVNICVKQNINDPKAGINLKKGCQDMDGGTALGFVRTRKTGNIPDFDRTQRQRQFFASVVKKAASPGVLLNPFRSIPLAASATDSVAVDPGTGAFDLLSLGLAMSGDPITTAVPIGSLPTINNAAVVKWDTQRALRLFNSLAEDKPVPKDVLSK
ncbi:LCP family protein [Sphaerisporangium aureirubrum]|uniref:LCP family protein n=1 Tax=Sphaerisporangium aureirubrum TaxID=1544736 RepID=A0ABW1NIY9_9ACTN